MNKQKASNTYILIESTISEGEKGTVLRALKCSLIICLLYTGASERGGGQGGHGIGPSLAKKSPKPLIVYI